MKYRIKFHRTNCVEPSLRYYNVEEKRWFGWVVVNVETLTLSEAKNFMNELKSVDDYNCKEKQL